MSSRMTRPEGRPTRRIPPVRCAPQAALGLDIGVARCLSVLHSVTEHSLLAGLALENVRASSSLETAASVDRALGQLEEIAREVRDLAYQLHTADIRGWPAGPDGAGESGTG